LLLLSVLSRGPGHGYEVITRLKVRSDGAFQLPEGTVYPALHRLEGAGLLASGWDVGAGRGGRLLHPPAAGGGGPARQAAGGRGREFSGSMARVLEGSASPVLATAGGMA